MTQKPYFGLILEFWIIFLIFYEWIILLNILDSTEWIFFWMNILDFVLNWILNWIIFRPDLMKKWIFKTDRSPLPFCAYQLIERKLLLSPQRHFLRKGFLLPTTGEVWDNLWKWGGICELWCEKRRNNGTMEHSAHGSLGTHTCVSSQVKRRIC